MCRLQVASASRSCRDQVCLGEQAHSVGYAVASGISEPPQGQNKFVEPRLRFERDIGRRRILEILRAVANDGRIFEHGQQGKAWQEHVEQLNQQDIFQIGGKGALKVHYDVVGKVVQTLNLVIPMPGRNCKRKIPGRAASLEGVCG
eukprot:768455-Hanusia_phi.AAC.15